MNRIFAYYINQYEISFLIKTSVVLIETPNYKMKTLLPPSTVTGLQISVSNAQI